MMGLLVSLFNNDNQKTIRHKVLSNAAQVLVPLMPIYSNCHRRHLHCQLPTNTCHVVFHHYNTSLDLRGSLFTISPALKNMYIDTLKVKICFAALVN